MISYFLIALFLLINIAIQILFKKIALGPGGQNYMALLLEPMFYLGVILFMMQAVVWLAVLRRLPLSRAYPFTSLTIIISLICGAVFFGESITLGNVLGSLVIMTGVVIIARDQGSY